MFHLALSNMAKRHVAEQWWVEYDVTTVQRSISLPEILEGQHGAHEWQHDTHEGQQSTHEGQHEHDEAHERQNEHDEAHERQNGAVPCQKELNEILLNS